MPDLDDEVYTLIKARCAEGDELVEANCFDEAIGKYEEALALVPRPLEDWSAATWIYAAIGDAWFLKGDYERARKAMNRALMSPEGIGNPFIHLRLGQAQFELGDMEKATDNLARALILEGKHIFAGENPKYFAYVGGLVRPPAGQDSW